MEFQQTVFVGRTVDLGSPPVPEDVRQHPARRWNASAVAGRRICGRARRGRGGRRRRRLGVRLLVSLDGSQQAARFFVGVAAGFGVSTVFAAFLAGYALINGIRDREKSALNVTLKTIKAVAFGVFVPIYFAIVGYRLSFGNDFSASMLLTFLVGSTLVVLIFVGLAARLAGFRGLDIVNFAIVANARGGPGIVLASIAFDAGLISGAFCTTLVITALFTSQMAGSWLRFVLRRGWPLLSTNPDEKAADVNLPAPSRPLLIPEFDFRKAKVEE